MPPSKAMDFDTYRQWNFFKRMGPAIHAPSWVREIILNPNICIEFLDVSEPAQGVYLKNHITATVTFANPVWVRNKKIVSARISMEPGPPLAVNKGAILNRGYRAGVHYLPGVFTLKLQHHLPPTLRSQLSRTFTMKAGVTIGELLDVVITNNMHHFLFLPYTVARRWKGCGDFMLQYWVKLVRSGIITDRRSYENPNGDFATDLTITYAPTGQTHERIARGWWVRWNPNEEDVLAPAIVYTEKLPVYA